MGNDHSPVSMDSPSPGWSAAPPSSPAGAASSSSSSGGPLLPPLLSSPSISDRYDSSSASLQQRNLWPLPTIAIVTFWKEKGFNSVCNSN